MGAKFGWPSAGAYELLRKRPRSPSQIENLMIGQFARGEFAMGEERTNIFLARVGILDARVIGAETLQQIFVGVRETGFGGAAIIPNDSDPAVGAEDARKFAASGFPAQTNEKPGRR